MLLVTVTIDIDMESLTFWVDHLAVLTNLITEAALSWQWMPQLHKHHTGEHGFTEYLLAHACLWVQGLSSFVTVSTVRYLCVQIPKYTTLVNCEFFELSNMHQWLLKCHLVLYPWASCVATTSACRASSIDLAARSSMTPL